MEYLRFDTRLMQNPDIKGVEYQRGTLMGWQLRHYILHRDQQRCQYCNKPGTKQRPLTLDHVIPESRGGPTVVGNLVAACGRCNTKKSNRSLGELLPEDPERAAQIQQPVDKPVPLASAGHLNSVMSSMLRVLEATGRPITITDGVSTAYTRDQLDVPKSPVNDAACLDLPTEVNNPSSAVTVLQRQSRHNRQSINCDDSGNPANKQEFPAYSRLPKAIQGYPTPPAHSVGQRRLKGIRTGDIIRIEHHSGNTFTGRATLQIKAKRAAVKTKGQTTATASASRAKLVAHVGRRIVSRCRSTAEQQAD